MPLKLDFVFWLRCFLLLFCPGLQCCLSAAGSGAPVITSIGEFYRHPAQSFSQGLDVRIKATVTYADEGWRQLYVQDALAGMYLDMQDVPIPIPLPEVVLIEGTTCLTNGFRRIQNLRVQSLEESSTPWVRNVSASDLYLSINGSCLVRVKGVVKSYVEEDRLVLKLDVNGSPIIAYIRDYRTADLEGLLGAKIRLTAVCSQQYDKDGKLEKVWLLGTGRRDIQIEAPGLRDPFDAIPHEIAEIHGTNAGKFINSRVQVHGMVTSWNYGDWVYINDGVDSIRAYVPFLTINPQGRKFEIVGSLKMTENGCVYLDDAVARDLDVVGKTNLLPPFLDQPNGIHRIEDLRNLSRPDAVKNLPVRVKGFVTFHDEVGQHIFISDGTNGIYVEGDLSGRLKPGMWLDVAGVTMGGESYTYVARADIRVVGSRQLPPPQEMNFDAASSGTNDSQWCQLSGVIQEFRERENRCYISVETDQGGVFHCWLAHVNDTNYLMSLANASVVIKGVCANQFNKNGQLSGFVMRVHDETFITKRGDSREVEYHVSDINRTLPPHFGNSLCRVVGFVTQRDSTGFYLQDKTGGIRVVPSSFSRIPNIGECLEVVGKRILYNYSPNLSSASFSAAEQPYRIKPRSVRGQNLLSGEYEGELVTIKAQVLERVASGNHPQFFAQDGHLIFQVIGTFTDEKCPEIQEGSIVSLTGVCAVSRVNAVEVKSSRLLLRSPKEMEVVWHPPTGLDWGRILVILGVLSAVLLAGCIWVLLLRRQVSLQTRQISDRLEREAALEAKLLQSQKMESIGQLAAGVAHDFNNLLTVIEGYATILSGDAALSKDGKNSVNSIVQASHRAAELTQQLLAFSRQQPMKLQMLDINAVLESASRLYARLLTESITLKTTLEPHLSPVYGDSGMIQQVVMNLLVNARDAMPSGGPIEISTRSVEITLEKATMPDRAGTFICVSVKDSGIGMSKEVMRRVFEPFFTTKEVGKGTGLGLATVHGIVQQHGGWVDVFSELGKGTTFDVYFPVYRAKPQKVVVPDEKKLVSQP